MNVCMSYNITYCLDLCDCYGTIPLSTPLGSLWLQLDFRRFYANVGKCLIQILNKIKLINSIWGKKVLFNCKTVLMWEIKWKRSLILTDWIHPADQNHPIWWFPIWHPIFCVFQTKLNKAVNIFVDYQNGSEVYKWYLVLVQDLDENMDENHIWVTQKTEDSKSNKENLTFPTHTVCDWIEL